MFSNECERPNHFVTFGYNSFVILHLRQWTGDVPKYTHSVSASLRILSDTWEFCQCDTTLYAIRFLRSDKNIIFRLWCQACGCWSRRTSVFYDTWLQQCEAVGFLFWRARNEAKRKLLSALDKRRWSKTQTKLEIDKLQNQKEYWI